MIRQVAARTSRSFAFRSGSLYRWILQWLMPVPKVSKKPLLDISLLTMCGASHLLMLECALYSIARYWSRLPPVTVVNDGTVPNSHIERRLRWWPAGLTVVPWQVYNSHHLSRGRSALVEYAVGNVFGRKLSAVLAEAETKRTFWCDTDMLFYTDFVPELCAAAPFGPVLWATLDWCYGYDTKLTGEMLAHLRDKPPVNTGLLLIEGSFYEPTELDVLVRHGLATCNPFTEQTILAEAVHKSGLIRWSLDKVLISSNDIFTWRPTFLSHKVPVRHHVTSVRHLFWRDALFMRILRPGAVVSR